MLLYVLHKPLSYDFEPIVPNGAKRRQPKRTSDDNPEAIRVSKGTRKRLNGIQTYLPYGRHPHWRHEKRPTKITSQILAVFSPSPFSFWLRGLDLHWKSIGESLCPFSPGLSMNGIGFLTHLVPGRHVLSSPQKKKEKKNTQFLQYVWKKWTWVNSHACRTLFSEMCVVLSPPVYSNESRSVNKGTAMNI